MNKTFKTTASVLLMSLSAQFIVAPAQAALIGTEQSQTQQADRSAVKSYFDRQHIADALREHGVSPDMAKSRVDAMTDGEVQRLANHISTEPAGAGVVGVIFSIFIILLITDILGFTKVYPFTRSIR